MKAIESLREQTEASHSPFQEESNRHMTKRLLALQQEHDQILRQIRSGIEALEAVRGNDRWSSSAGRISRRFATLEKLIMAHLRNEERILLPIISEHFDDEAVDYIKKEHSGILTTLRGLNNHVSRIDGVQRRRIPTQTLTQRANDFASILRVQFSREENVIYWFANICISKSGKAYDGRP